MSFPRYPRYKDSGVEWLGQVPEQWDLRSLKSILAERNEKNDPIKTEHILSLTMDRGVIPYAERGGGGNKAKDDLTAYKLAYPNDIVLNSMNVIVGSVGLSTYFGAVSPVYYMLYPRCDYDEVRYFAQIFQAATFQKSLVGLGNGIMVKESESSGKLNTIRMRIPMGKLNSVVLPYPNPREQIRIAEFLEHETRKIDELVAEQRRLMELLKEKRQAVISHAVTRGLNPATTLKPSGIEWLGDVPAHWEVKPMRMIANVVRGASPRPAGDPRFFGGDEVPWVTVAEITKDNEVYLKGTETFLTQEGATHSNLFRSGTLIYSNSGATLGVPKILRIDACANDGVVAFLNLSSEVCAEFLYHYLASITDCIRDKVKQGSGQPNLNTDIVKDLRFGLPPMDEQEAIVSRITELAGQFDTLTAEAQHAIDLLQERRTALISAAVTGQIDVRGLAPHSLSA